MLGQTRESLVHALTQDNQGSNPGAWYYLGRYYVEVNDAAGADSAFRRAETLAPQCAADIQTYRRRLWAATYNEGLRHWQESREDSATAWLRLAARVLPSDPRAPFALGKLYANRDQTDSAVAYLRQGASLAAGDTVFARDRREALATIGRLQVRRAQASPVFQQWQGTRYSRDSLERAIANDSTVLGRMVASSASRRARGTRLSPADQQVFARDSAARVQGLARGRDARGPLVQQMGRDSAALAALLDPAFQAYRDYLAAYPASVDAAVTLATLYGQTGRGSEAAAVLDDLLRHAGDLPAEQLFEAGRRLAGANLALAAARVYGLGIEKSPHHRDALLELTTILVQIKDTARALPAAQRLIALDPLNRTAVRLLGAAWQLRGRPDSTAKYVALADSVLVVDVSVTSFLVQENGALLSGVAHNARNTPAAPIRLAFEFLDAAGGVQAAAVAEIPALTGGASHPFELRPRGTGIVAWRYRGS